MKYRLLLLLAALIWGFAFVAQVIGMDSIGPYAFNGIRFLLGSLSLLPIIYYYPSGRNPKEASKVLFKLEDLLRYQINDSSRERVSLASDIRFLNDYLNLEKIRRDNFQFTLRQEGEVDSIWIQPLLFIPFVENAVKHSFDSEHSSYVHVFFKVEAHRLEFRCENSKPAVAVQQGKVGGIGLANIQRRLGLLYPEHYKLEQREDENLYSVILSITL